MTDPFLQHFKEYADRRPRYADVWNDLGLVLSSHGDSDAALSAFNRALMINPAYLEARISRCYVLGELERVEEAFRGLCQLPGRGTDDFDSAFAVGVFCLRHGWQKSGSAQLLTAVTLKPAPYVHLYAAAAFRELGDDNSADKRIERARESLAAAVGSSPPEGMPTAVPDPRTYASWDNPFMAKLAVLRSHFLTANGDADAAFRVLVAANAHWPGHSQLMVEMAKLLVAESRQAEAVDWLSAALRVDRSCDAALFERSFLHAEAGRFDDAETDLRTAVALRPLFLDYRYNLGTLLHDTGKPEEAIEQLERALILNPDYAQGTLHLAGVYLEMGSPEKAVALLDRGSCDSWPEASILAAEAHAQLENLTEARSILEKVLESDPEHPDAREALASLETA